MTMVYLLALFLLESDLPRESEGPERPRREAPPPDETPLRDGDEPRDDVERTIRRSCRLCS